MNIALNLLGLNPEQGGMYQYAVTFTRHLLNRDRTNTYVVFYDYPGIPNEHFNLTRAILVRVARPLALGLTLFGRPLWAPAARNAQRIFNRLLRVGPQARRCIQGEYSIFTRHRTQFLIQPSHVRPDPLVAGLPYLIAIHDAPYQWSDDHRARRSPRFLTWYEWLIKQLTREARMILVDSPNGRAAMIDGYGVPPHRVRILPFRPPDHLLISCNGAQRDAVKKKYNLPDCFVFYPSKLLAHKNHLGVIEALNLLRREHGVILHLILSGSVSGDGTLERMTALLNDYQMVGQVHYLGYVPDEDMAALYALSQALVFPTLMGPTALPILEAFAAGCPVVCSNVEGYAEQVGDAGLLFDPNNVNELAEALHAICTNAELRAGLREKGGARLRAAIATDYGDDIYSAVIECVTFKEN